MFEENMGLFWQSCWGEWLWRGGWLRLVKGLLVLLLRRGLLAHLEYLYKFIIILTIFLMYFKVLLIKVEINIFILKINLYLLNCLVINYGIFYQNNV